MDKKQQQHKRNNSIDLESEREIQLMGNKNIHREIDVKRNSLHEWWSKDINWKKDAHVHDTHEEKNAKGSNRFWGQRGKHPTEI